ncbi:MAG: DUF1501 domain-containing protein [Gemmatales bacterium]|nr:DUF1501 domain-containing protein [Gemmatales bacterium]MCS7159577.1 DUF1501 domain-containing protein [Gemmatales bacterium]MDW8174775.1 DUF1501 domain-containing protein [Gemmatales bacterium]MDW8223045.1 DUF1501 domain-containing protein [Gemmatales bacterium]
MLRLATGAVRLCEGVTRREFLRLGAVGSALTLAEVLRAEDRAGTRTGRARACILLFLQGGQSQLDTFDMKPAAPENVRGEFRPIATSVPGLHICEHLPRLARLAHLYTIVRSMTHRMTNHNPAGYLALSGMAPERDVVALKASSEDYPHPGAVLAQTRPTSGALPPFVQISAPMVGDGNVSMPGQNAGFLGPQYDPFRFPNELEDERYDVPELTLPNDVSSTRLQTRRSLLQQLDRALGQFAESAAVARMEVYYRRAYELLGSSQARRAFHLHEEPQALRARYGRHRWGQALLLARRLIEAGVRMVTVYWGGALNSPDPYWDTHKRNFAEQKEKLLPQFDQCLSALLEDLKERGLLETTLVISMGEFGRTPRLGQVTANAGTDATGRDHWPYCYSILLAGGGIAGGGIVGQSDKLAAWPTERPITPADLVASMYYALGVPLDSHLYDRLGRQLLLTHGRVVQELFA